MMSASDEEEFNNGTNRALLNGSPNTPDSYDINHYEEIPLATSGSSESGYEEEGSAPEHTPPNENNAITTNGSSSPASKLKLNNSEDIYAVIDKSRKKSIEQGTKNEEDKEEVPLGWKKCFDDEGAYYWHIRSGRIQRDKPSIEEGDATDVLSPQDHLRSMESSLLNLADKTMRSMSLTEETLAFTGPEQPLRFSVHSIGWVPLAESDLKDQDTSCKSINRCILDLTAGRANEGLGQWCEGKELCMEIDGKELCLMDPVTTTVLSVQPIHTIRVWGVGSHNSCDFAYVARDPMTRIHKCHVFRCEVPARQIANTLKEICTRLAKERKANKNNNSPEKEKSTAAADRTKLNALQLVAEKGKVLPSPMDGPSKTKKCHYLGHTKVQKPSGMDVVNSAIEKLSNATDRSSWMLVNVTVSPAAVKVTDANNDSDIKLDTRLRFLCYFGISAHDVRLMGMVVHTADDEFICHVFHCEPSAGALCKIIEAACKLRYQKLLDSMPEQQSLSTVTPSPTTTNKGIQQTVKNIFSRVWSGRKT